MLVNLRNSCEVKIFMLHIVLIKKWF